MGTWHMIINFDLYSSREMLLFMIWTLTECWEETKREEKVLMSKVKTSEKFP